jgi:hydrogenase expression/formation protein HypE
MTADVERICLAHGEGGRLSRKLIQERILPKLRPHGAMSFDDAAVLPRPANQLAFSTDSFVVWPLFFPGGDIGRLAICGTVNDLVVRGATPLYISLALIIEEGFPLATLDEILESVAAAAQECGVIVVAGDTKVVPRGAADGLFICTSGVGAMVEPAPLGPGKLQPGHALLVSNFIGRHGVAILAAREDLEFDPPPRSDCAPLLRSAGALRDAGIEVLAMRDATRGGVAAVLHEWAAESKRTLYVDEQALPVTVEVRAACELLGLDPLHLANEGAMLVAVPDSSAEAARNALRAVAESCGAEIIGRVMDRTNHPVLVRRALGREQPLDDPQGAPLPRIC